jgi:hypothetical protein
MPCKQVMVTPVPTDKGDTMDSLSFFKGSTVFVPRRSDLPSTTGTILDFELGDDYSTVYAKVDTQGREDGHAWIAARDLKSPKN